MIPKIPSKSLPNLAIFKNLFGVRRKNARRKLVFRFAFVHTGLLDELKAYLSVCNQYKLPQSGSDRRNNSDGIDLRTGPRLASNQGEVCKPDIISEGDFTTGAYEQKKLLRCVLLYLSLSLLPQDRDSKSW